MIVGEKQKGGLAEKASRPKKASKKMVAELTETL